MMTWQASAAAREAGGRAQESAPGTFHLGYRPDLDGLRGVAISIVVAYHVVQGQNAYAFIGVNLFFVLSGFLITCLLLEEWQQGQGINLGAFYARRALRLLPALGVLLLTFVIVSALMQPRKVFLLDVKHALTALFYFTNWALIYYPEDIFTLRHTWSLSIEEQFYLVWPWLLRFLLRHSAPASVFNFVLLGVFCSWFTRILLYLGTTSSPIRFFCGLDTRADSLLAGCAVALLLACGRLPQSARSQTVLRYGASGSVAALAVIGVACQPFSPGMYCLGWFLISLFGALMILALSAIPQSGLHRLLAHPMLVFLGRISYGLYLWHYLILMLDSHCGLDWPAWKRGLLKAALIPLTTLASYYWVERPCLRFKKRFQKVD